jgi:hypothetical protein
MPYELDVVHPAGAIWLTQHGYTFKHEYPLIAGIVDFVAYKNGRVYIVEAKTALAAAGFPLHVNQILGYAFQYSVMYSISATPCLMAPEIWIDDLQREICKRLHIEIFPITCMTDAKYIRLKNKVGWLDWTVVSRNMRSKVVNTAFDTTLSP